MTRDLRVVVSSLTVLWLSACGQDAPPPPEPEVVPVSRDETSEGQLGPALTSSAGRLLVPEVRIGGHPELLLSVFEAAVGPNGTLAVSQRQDPSVRLYSPGASAVRSVGREGSGPGEFRSIFGLGWTADTLWVWDTELRRVTFFRPDGSVVRTVSLAAVTAGRASRQGWAALAGRGQVLAADRDGGFLLAPSRVPVRGTAPFESGTPLFRVSEEGEIDRLVAFGPSVDESVLRSFYAEPHRDVSSGGEYLATTSTHLPDAEPAATLTRVSLFTTEGDTLFSTDLVIETEEIPRHVADSAREAVFASARRQLGRAGEEVVATALARLDRLVVPAAYRPIEALTVGRDGKVWLRLRDAPGTHRWLILDRRGEPVDTIAGAVGPHRNSVLGTEILAADSAGFWLREIDEWDVPSLVRYRIEPGG